MTQEPTPEPTPEDAEQPWERLDPRMLLVHPFRQLGPLLPLLVPVVVAGRALSGPFNAPWELLGLLVVAGTGVWSYLTTEYRLGPERVELRRGLLARRVLTAPLDRVRTVDLSSTLVHRLLGLASVRIGTGTSADGSGLELDGLRTARAEALRRSLLERAALARAEADGPDNGDAEPTADLQADLSTEPSPALPADRPPTTVLRLDPRWARYAPLSMAGLALSGVVVGGGSQVVVPVLQALGINPRPEWLPHTWSGAVALTVLLLLVVLVAVPVLAALGYLATSWGLVLTREAGPRGDVWRLRRGLLTTRETTLDAARVSGVVLSAPVGLRAVGAGRLEAMTTGLDREDRGTLELVPPAPAAVLRTTGAAVLDDPDPLDRLDAGLARHGAAATRRRWRRTLTPLLVVAPVALVVPLLLPHATPGVLLDGLRLGVPVACAVLLLPAAWLARSRARALGHALTERHLVARQGSLVQRTHVLDLDHVIGWTWRDSWFQRRAGLVSLDATTAGGPQRVTVLDVPEDVAVALALRAQPGLLEPFTQVTGPEEGRGANAPVR
ncbi:PH domain-containing protein [Nocardioides sp. GY 10127]|uniref:PH domain-containing protein n=1 Tax=Nocardioides sp. GY 10127 TaxID=2569762 RepID=UPI0010A811C0|nr:PH domain-containing protein [Nocardioides sp. GY 10127]TIC84263.1 hypothetical protein E8D37_05645 [Nocardioides sp. GY 10127]